MSPHVTCGGIKKRADGKISEIEEKMATLQRMKEVFMKLDASCPGEGLINECPIFEALDKLGGEMYDHKAHDSGFQCWMSSV
jgi:MerR family mercuric resistance operon transcriptional regulator